MRPELRSLRIALIGIALCAAGAEIARAQHPGEAQRPGTAPPVPAPKPAPAQKPPPAPKSSSEAKPAPAPAQAPAPAPKPKPKPKPAPAPPSHSDEDERIVRDLELYMLFEMLNDYEIFYDDPKADKKR